jgi:hypothetical protein
LCLEALEFRPVLIVSGARPAAERAWLMSARTWAVAPPDEVPAGLVADVPGDAEADLEDADADGDGLGWRCLVRAAGGLGESEAGTLATPAWNGCPAQAPADPAAGGSHAEDTRGAAVTGAAAEAGAGAEPRVR